MTFATALITSILFFGLGFLACWMMPVKPTNDALNDEWSDYP